jgi:hypothetical protein
MMLWIALGIMAGVTVLGSIFCIVLSLVELQHTRHNNALYAWTDEE